MPPSEKKGPGEEEPEEQPDEEESDEEIQPPPENDDSGQGLLELWEAAARGEEAAKNRVMGLIEEIAGDYLPRYRLDPNDVADIIQETCVSVLCAMEDYLCNPHTKLKGFLYFRLRAVVRAYFARHRIVPLERELGSGDSSQLRGLEDRERSEMINDCLNRLPDHQRQALVERHAHGRKPADIAQDLDEPVEKVRVWIFRAVRAMRTCLGHKLEDKEPPQ